MRIRSVKPEFWEDPTVAALSPVARLVFIGTWNLADDTGVLRWTVDYVNASLFMYDDLSGAKVRKLMDEVEAQDLVLPYEGKAGQTLAVIPNFHKHQKPNRPQPSKLPQPPAAIRERCAPPAKTKPVNDSPPEDVPNSRSDSVNGTVSETVSESVTHSPPEGRGGEGRGLGDVSQSRLKPPDSKRGNSRGEKEKDEEKPRSEAPPDPILKRFVDVWPGRNRGLECAVVLAELRPHFDDAFIDEGIGHMLERHPSQPGYLRTILVDWALQRGVYTPGDEAIRVLSKAAS